jgi:integrase
MSCNAKRDPNGTWRIQYRWTDYTGKNRKSQKRGFRTKKEAEDWLMQFKLQQSDDLTMTFSRFWEVYKEDMKTRIRETTMRNKEYIVKDKILPYFGNTPLNEITAPKIRKWQSDLMEKGYKPTYLKTVNNQLSAILNYAVRYYDLKSNPCHKAGSMGKSRADKMDYWTMEEFNRFGEAVIDKQTSWIAFKILFWTGMRLGEMLALTIGDIDFDKGVIEITKSLARVDGKDVITPPKTEASIRTITMPEELKLDLQEYVSTIYRPTPKKRIFGNITKSYLEHEMKRGIEVSGVKKIHLHCLRHSHASMLVQLGFSPLEIANRLGHGRVTTTIETYCHPSMDAQERIADRLSALEKDGESRDTKSGSEDTGKKDSEEE